MVSLLIDNKADVNAQSETGRALLHVAVGKANRTQTLDTSIIKALLEAEGTNVNAVDGDGKTPLHEAAKSYDKEIVTVLLEAKGIYVTPLDNTSSTPLNLAFQQGRKHIVKILEETQQDIEALYSAVKSDNYEEVQSLLSKKVNVNSIDKNGKTPLHWAVGIGHKEVVEALLGKGADVNTKNNYGNIPLHWAVGIGHKEIVEALLDKDGIDVNAQDNDGWTPLHFAAQNGEKDVVKALLDKGANVDVQNDEGETPFNSATDKGIQNLLQSVKEANDKLLEAAKSGNIDDVKNLLDEEGKAQVNAKNEFEETPLHLATQNGHKDVVEFLF